MIEITFKPGTFPDTHSGTYIVFFLNGFENDFLVGSARMRVKLFKDLYFLVVLTFSEQQISRINLERLGLIARKLSRTKKNFGKEAVT